MNPDPDVLTREERARVDKRLGPYQLGSYRVSIIREGEPLEVEGRRVSDAATAFRVLRPLLPEDDERERFGFLALTIRHEVKGWVEVSVGCLSSNLVHPREVFRPAILLGAAAIILAHNHPSGDPEPSQEDLALTRRLESAGTLLGMTILDHVILGRGKWVSLKERGILS